MRLGGLLAELQQLIRLVALQRVQVDAVHRLVEVVRGVLDVALSASTLAERIVAGERVVGVVQQLLELAGRLFPAVRFLIEPAEEIVHIGAIDTASEQLLADLDRLAELTLLLQLLRFTERRGHLGAIQTRATTSFIAPWTVPATSAPVVGRTHPAHALALTTSPLAVRALLTQTAQGVARTSGYVIGERKERRSGVMGDTRRTDRHWRAVRANRGKYIMRASVDAVMTT